ncbi:MAG: DUF11 domain-containing protein [Actinobacteria bacterium]|nr:MAG: DUF11 domain-containing protein [Actinomycetota bacterium]
MSLVPRLFYVRRKFAVIVPLVVMAFLATPALPAGAASPSADLATTITAHGTNVQGGSIGYTITATNNGPDAASGVVMTDHIPFSMWSRYPTTFLCVGSVQPVGTPGWCGPLQSSVSCTAPPVGSTGTVSCTTRSLAPGASMTIEMAIHVGFYLSSHLVEDTATTTSGTFDPNTANNTASVAVGRYGPVG